MRYIVVLLVWWYPSAVPVEHNVGPFDTLRECNERALEVIKTMRIGYLDAASVRCRKIDNGK